MDDLYNLNGNIIIPTRASIDGSIFISPQNKMSGTVSIIGLGSSDLTSSLVVTRFNDFPSNMIVYSDQVIEDISYPPRYGNQRKAHLYILHRSDLISNILVPPYNRMAGRTDIIQPPSYTTKLTSIKDAFIRSGIPTLNYGTEESMVVGYDAALNEKFRSFVEFDITQIPENVRIEKASLKLFNSKLNSGTHQIGVYTTAAQWVEDGVTWISQPAVLDIVNIATVGDQGYTDIDVTNSIKNWYNGTGFNHGFIVKALNESYSQIEQFSTRESPTDKPVLEVTYKLNVVYSPGRTELPSNMFVYSVGKSEIGGNINIREYGNERELRSSIHVHNFNYWLEASIVVSKPDLPSSIIVRRSDKSDISSSLMVRVKGGYLPQDNLQGNIVVSAPDRVGRISVPYRDNLSANIKVIRRINDKADFQGSIQIIRDSLVSKIRVRQKDTTVITGSIQARIHNNFPSKIVISRPSISGSLKVTYYSQITGSITVRTHNDIQGHLVVPSRNNIVGNMFVIHASHLPSSIYVLSGYLKASITIPAYAENDLLARATIRVKSISELHSSIYVGGDNLPIQYVFII